MGFLDFIMKFFSGRDDSGNGHDGNNDESISMTDYDWGYYDGIDREENKDYSEKYRRGFETGQNDLNNLSEIDE